MSAQNVPVINLPEEIRVKPEIFTLGEIAEITGPVETREKLSAISLGYSPQIGAVREISRERITLFLGAAGFSAGDYILNSSPVIRIRRFGQRIEGDLIRERIEQIILGQFSDSAVEARINRLDLPDGIEVPVGEVEIIPSLNGVNNLFQPFSMPVEIRLNGKLFRRISITAEIEAWAKVLVADRELAPGTRIVPPDFRPEKVRLEKQISAYFTGSADLRGLQAIKTVAKNEPLTAGSVVSAVVIKSGDLVKITGQSGKMQIIVSGEARSSGRIGDRIAVKNTQSGNIIQATVIDEGLVKVYF
ncbi:MAG: flagellar basal body P-ring formation chaperone FlgA [Pyrinomonadaceae bacterium]